MMCMSPKLMYIVLQTRVAKCPTTISNKVILKEGMILNLSNLCYYFINLGEVREPFSFKCGHTTLFSANDWFPLDKISFHHIFISFAH